MSLHVQTSLDRAPDHGVRSICPACGSAEVADGIRVPDHEYRLSYVARYKECSACGTLFQEPMPTLAELASFYPLDYHSMTHAGLLTRIRNGMRIRRLAKLLAREGAILDYGCGGGAVLVQAAERLPRRQFWGEEIAHRPEGIVLRGGGGSPRKEAVTELVSYLPV